MENISYVAEITDTKQTLIENCNDPENFMIT